MYHSRKYESQLSKILKVFPAVGIVGPRQVGKTTFVRRMLKDIVKESLYLDLERNSDYNKISDPELFLTLLSCRCPFWSIINSIITVPSIPLLRAAAGYRTLELIL